MAWRRTATSHWLNQCWLKPITPHGSTCQNELIYNLQGCGPFSFYPELYAFMISKVQFWRLCRKHKTIYLPHARSVLSQIKSPLICNMVVISTVGDWAYRETIRNERIPPPPPTTTTTTTHDQSVYHARTQVWKTPPFRGFWTKKTPLFQPKSLILRLNKTPLF